MLKLNSIRFAQPLPFVVHQFPFWGYILESPRTSLTKPYKLRLPSFFSSSYYLILKGSFHLNPQKPFSPSPIMHWLEHRPHFIPSFVSGGLAGSLCCALTFLWVSTMIGMASFGLSLMQSTQIPSTREMCCFDSPQIRQITVLDFNLEMMLGSIGDLHRLSIRMKSLK